MKKKLGEFIVNHPTCSLLVTIIPMCLVAGWTLGYGGSCLLKRFSDYLLEEKE